MVYKMDNFIDRTDDIKVKSKYKEKYNKRIGHQPIGSWGLVSGHRDALPWKSLPSQF
jgi:hypothetical protein